MPHESFDPGVIPKPQLILVVDDDETSRLVLKTLLNRRGFRVDTVGTVAEALDYIEMGHYSLVLTDVHLPDLHGEELTKAIRRHTRLSQVPVIAISSDDGRESVRRMVDAGVNEFLVKPILSDVLNALLGRWIPE